VRNRNLEKTMTYTFFITFFVTISYISSAHVHGNEVDSRQVVTPSHTGYKNLGIKKELEFSERSWDVSEGRSFHLGNISTALSTLVNSTFIFKALLIYWIHAREIYFYRTFHVWSYFSLCSKQLAGSSPP
jgi:hypothetical protein